jgi:hypothetical protein
MVVAAQAQVWPIPHSHDHVQGLDLDAQWFWISAVDRRTRTGWIWRVDRQSLRTVAERNITDGVRYHPGGFQVTGETLWIPVAEYRANSTTRILELDRMTLVQRRSFLVEDHIGALATDGHSVLLGANWDARRFYRWTLGGQQLAVVANRHSLAVQDMKWSGGTVFAGGTGVGRSKGQCQLHQLDPSTFELVRASGFKAGTCYTREGMAVFGGRFFFLPEDEPNSRVYSVGATSTPR